MKRVMLYFGSFNPIHKGHIALAEYAVEKELCDELVLVVSPQSPYKQAEELAPEMDRFEMAEAACAASRYPDRIKPSSNSCCPSRRIRSTRCATWPRTTARIWSSRSSWAPTR